ncbi:hypothetical protein GNI_067680 [Gregarina niphandrodes]|uniref:Uncharacterized protein n=1 Tax=Gregarina niphandrodes TaxID=110365 RepID=A0A023B7Q9_GRENI|nr:hypothetical protein GNI_067680 [Gregarina niphandrodes]EZG67582.1 hypothetical protein GNI_067680 [Gregarina niphandrodes]|eukprot:XP_011130198.1 hypothetical protein GNI_067680 [Gregarina niphandrodes]
MLNPLNWTPANLKAQALGSEANPLNPLGLSPSDFMPSGVGRKADVGDSFRRDGATGRTRPGSAHRGEAAAAAGTATAETASAETATAETATADDTATAEGRHRARDGSVMRDGSPVRRYPGGSRYHAGPALAYTGDVLTATGNRMEVAQHDWYHHGFQPVGHWLGQYAYSPPVVFPDIISYDFSYYPYAHQNDYVQRGRQANSGGPPVWNVEAALGYRDYLQRLQGTKPRTGYGSMPETGIYSHIVRGATAYLNTPNRPMETNPPIINPSTRNGRSTLQ